MGFFIFMLGAAVSFGIALGSGLCVLGGCLKVPGWMNLGFWALGVALLGGGVVGYVLTSRQDRDPPRRWEPPRSG
jgi:hypothetical protein